MDTVARWKIVDPLMFYQTVQSEQGAIARLNHNIFARLREEIGNHNFEEFIREKRERIMNQVTKGTAEMARSFGIEVIDVRIKRVDLPEEVQKSVFARMNAERERIAKRYRLKVMKRQGKSELTPTRKKKSSWLRLTDSPRS